MKRVGSILLAFFAAFVLSVILYFGLGLGFWERLPFAIGIALITLWDTRPSPSGPQEGGADE